MYLACQSNWDHCPFLSERNVTKGECINARALQTLRCRLRKPVLTNLWPSLTLQLVLIAALCVMLFSFFVFFCQLFPWFIYKSPTPKHLVINKEREYYLSFHRTVVIDKKTSKKKPSCLASKQKAERVHVLGSCGRSKDHRLLTNKNLVSNLKLVTCHLVSNLKLSLILAKSPSPSNRQPLSL